ncbi:hypothetical protein GCM10027425_25290 [Alteromonas gracilis]
MSDRTPEQIEADLERQRERLAETVDDLQAKLDVKARASDKVHELGDRATTDDGRPRPAVLAGAGGAVAAVGCLVWWRRKRRRS